MVDSSSIVALPELTSKERQKAGSVKAAAITKANVAERKAQRAAGTLGPIVMYRMALRPGNPSRKELSRSKWAAHISKNALLSWHFSEREAGKKIPSEFESAAWLRVWRVNKAKEENSKFSDLLLVPARLFEYVAEDIHKAWVASRRLVDPTGEPTFERYDSQSGGFGLDGVIEVTKTHLCIPKHSNIRQMPNVRPDTTASPRGGWSAQRSRIPTGHYDRVRITQNHGEWFASLPIQLSAVKRVDPVPAVGLDWGVRKLATLSDGTIYKNPKALKQIAKKARKWQLKVARKQREADKRLNKRVRAVAIERGIDISPKKKIKQSKAITPLVSPAVEIKVKGKKPRKQLEGIELIKYEIRKEIRTADRLSSVKQQSDRIRRARKGLANQYFRARNIRKNAIEHASCDIAHNHAVVAAETLKVKNMTRKKVGKGRAAKAALNRAILDSAPGMLLRRTDTKLQQRRGGGILHVYTPGTSQECSGCNCFNNCGSNVVYTCAACGLIMDRDLNASKIILQRGLKLIQSRGGVAAGWPETIKARTSRFSRGIRPLNPVAPVNVKIETL